MLFDHGSAYRSASTALASSAKLTSSASAIERTVTIILVCALATVLWVVRSRWRLLGGLWRSACWWERAVLVLALAPLPGPFEEVAGLAVARRVVARQAQQQPK